MGNGVNIKEFKLTNVYQRLKCSALYMGPVCTPDHLPETWYIILNHWAVFFLKFDVGELY
jgi:hypothetical protein